MKKKLSCLYPLLAGMVFSATAYAGYVGTSVGYMLDAKNEIFSVKSGTSFAEDKTISQNFELELVYTDDSERYTDTIEGQNISWDVGFEVIPLLANYVVKGKLRPDLHWYTGAGAGYSFYDISASTFTGGQNLSFGDSGGAFTWQFMFGIEYKFSPSTAIKLGYRYFELDDLDFSVDGFTSNGDSYSLDDVLSSGNINLDDSVLEVGLVFKY